jgi:hypothetical protein
MKPWTVKISERDIRLRAPTAPAAIAVYATAAAMIVFGLIRARFPSFASEVIPQAPGASPWMEGALQGAMGAILTLWALAARRGVAIRAGAQGLMITQSGYTSTPELTFRFPARSYAPGELEEVAAADVPASAAGLRNVFLRSAGGWFSVPDLRLFADDAERVVQRLRAWSAARSADG